MTEIVVLGAGRVGAAIARDLSREGDFHVTAVDSSETTLARLGEHGVAGREVDLSDSKAVRQAVRGADLVVGAVPGFMGHAVLRDVIAARKNVVDISFLAEDPFSLDAAAREANVTVVVDCGVAPGLSNMILGHMVATLDDVERFECIVGGLPIDREPPWEYRAPFSPCDVIEEYTRPARMRRNGETVILPALSELEAVEVSGVGTLEAFNTDGLRTLLTTCAVPNLSEKTLRYPGHAEKISTLREAGFFDTDPVRVGTAEFRPIDLTSELLTAQWLMGPEDRDLTVMRVTVDGVSGGSRVRHRFDLLDRYDEDSGITSMSRTTGFTCSAVARLVARGAVEAKGIVPPEVIGREASHFESVVHDLVARGMTLNHAVMDLPRGD